MQVPFWEPTIQKQPLRLVFPHFPICTKCWSLFHFNELAEWNQTHIPAYSCALHCVGCESDSSLTAYFFPLIVEDISLDLLCIYGFGLEGGEDASLLLLKCHRCVLLCSQLISDVGLFGNHPFCFFYSIWRLSVHWRLIIKCWGVTVCMFNTLWPHVCCSLSFCYVFFFPICF